MVESFKYCVIVISSLLIVACGGKNNNSSTVEVKEDPISAKDTCHCDSLEFVEQRVQKHETNEVVSQNFKINGSRYTGVCLTYYPNGQQKQLREFILGKARMKFSWYENGSKKTELTFKSDSTEIGDLTKYYPSGELQSTGQILGPEIWGMENYHGLLTGYYQSGQKQVESTYVDGLKYGKETYWYENGQIESIGFYEDGFEVPPYTSFYENGETELEITGRTTNKLEFNLTGKKIWRDESGNAIKEYTYVDGVKTDSTFYNL
jgi:antitoxin component YwqK of YwqJK toxin-antitoxin module